jgi:hypothetical protein
MNSDWKWEGEDRERGDWEGGWREGEGEKDKERGKRGQGKEIAGEEDEMIDE